MNNKKFLVRLFIFASILLLASAAFRKAEARPVSDSTQITVEIQDRVLLDIEILPEELLLNRPRQQFQLRVIGIYSDNTTANLTHPNKGTTYISDNPAVVTVNSYGLLTAFSEGSAVITATNSGLSDLVEVVVDFVILERIELKPKEIYFHRVPESANLTVIGYFSDGSTANLTRGSSGTRYQVDYPTTASISPNGRLTALADGSAWITVTNDGLYDTAKVTVKTNEDLMAIEVTPSELSFTRIKQRLRLRVIGIYYDGDQTDISPPGAGTRYYSDDPEVAKVNPSGLVTATGEGTTVITVSNSGIIAEVLVLVKVAELVAIEILPIKNPLTRVGQKVRLTVIGHFSDGSRLNLTRPEAGTRYHSNRPEVAAVNKCGVITAVSDGVARITATNRTFSDSIIPFWLR